MEEAQNNSNPEEGQLIRNFQLQTHFAFMYSVKSFESIIFNKIINFIRPKISPYQFGFMKGKSCLSQLLHAFSVVHEAFDKRKQVDIYDLFGFQESF